MPSPYVEFRDSRVLVTEWDGPHARLRMDLHLHIPAAEDPELETIGVQHAALVLENARFQEEIEGGFAWVRGGELTCGDRKFTESFPLPFDAPGPVTLFLHGLEGDVRATATAARVEPMGPVVTTEEIQSE